VEQVSHLDQSLYRNRSGSDGHGHLHVDVLNRSTWCEKRAHVAHIGPLLGYLVQSRLEEEACHSSSRLF
jgi:hypothetical protein